MAFRLVLGLRLTPDSSAAMTGREAPPRVNHDRVDFRRLSSLLLDTFRHGPSVDILVANDTVDQVTAHMRMGWLPGVRGAASEDLKACRDFGQALLGLAERAVDGVIDVRAAWRTKHEVFVRDRTFAPPPVLIPFVVRAADYDDAQLWHFYTRPVLGLSLLDPYAPAQHDESFAGGRLPPVLKEGLRGVFGCPFEEYPALLDRLAMDRPPV